MSAMKRFKVTYDNGDSRFVLAPSMKECLAYVERRDVHHTNQYGDTYQWGELVTVELWDSPASASPPHVGEENAVSEQRHTWRLPIGELRKAK